MFTGSERALEFYESVYTFIETVRGLVEVPRTSLKAMRVPIEFARGALLNI
jgi:hypothetical protein